MLTDTLVGNPWCDSVVGWEDDLIRIHLFHVILSAQMSIYK